MDIYIKKQFERALSVKGKGKEGGRKEELKKLVETLSYDIDTGKLDEYPKLEKSIKRIYAKLLKYLYVVNEEFSLTKNEFEDLKLNGYI